MATESKFKQKSQEVRMTYARMTEVMKGALEGKSFKEMGDWYGISSTHASQIYRDGCRRISVGTQLGHIELVVGLDVRDLYVRPIAKQRVSEWVPFIAKACETLMSRKLSAICINPRTNGLGLSQG